ncbi:diguanylate cyclase (GGDEF)-like protein [Rhizobium sp. BK226]|uniref:GGDEF domain-containing protein n=1 Tax=Rhizobium TaxID=379 RepID=UPI00160E2519|nr:MULTISPECIES: GGDEF domain-containing protein [Rhizobium]MBB4110868.1 diguanylate cyclase (GGDEF)-like protein [Rhizobium sp. BK226]UTS89688.1 GGDEF domain-containing protein [Rhizobium anhuiense bv. trifolii]
MGSTDNFAFLLPAIMLVFGCTFLLLRRQGLREAGYWAAAYFLGVAAFSMPLLSGLFSPSILSPVADALFVSAFYFYSGALLFRFGRPGLVGGRLAFCGLSIVATSYSALVAENLPAELVINDLSCAALLTFAVAMSATHTRHVTDRLLLIIAALIVLDTVGRNVMLVFVVPSYGVSAEGFLSSNYDFMMQASASILSLLFGLAALGAAALDMITRYRDVADHDPLTGLLNRRGFDRTVAGRAGGAMGSVIICDIDAFKRVNDTLGHAAGDLVIRGLAGLLAAQLPKGAFAARFGGEEFVAFLPDMTLAQAGAFANTIRLAFAAIDRSALGVDQAITASFGAAEHRPSDRSLHEQIGRADIALYAAKQAGRNRVMLEGEPPRDMPAIRIASVA